jgi:predicted AAA+ superfamily ATPase
MWLGVGVAAPTMRRFWTMLAHDHGQVWNGAELSRAFGVSDKTVRGYLDVLAGTFVVRVLPPWHENLGKRQVKSPKVDLRDSGLLHALLDLETHAALEGHAKVGASWEGFALETLIHHLGARPDQVFFWATHGGAELDLLVVRGADRFGFELRRTSAPQRTRSMTVALQDLGLRSHDVIYPGTETWPMAPGIRAVGLPRIFADVPPLR